MLKSKDKIHNLLVANNLSKGARDFLENVKIKIYQTLSPDFMHNFQLANSSKYYKDVVENKTHNVDLCDKEYDLSKIDFTTVEQDFLNLMTKRKSYWTFRETMNKEELFKTLKLSYFSHSVENIKKRNAASGGGMYPIEIYFLNLNIQDLEKGIFYYNVDEEKLQLIQSMEDTQSIEFIQKAFLADRKSDIEYFKSSGVIFLCGILDRSTFKYEDLGIKLAFIEAGAILQNIYLTCTVTNIKCCACNGYVDSYIEEIINLKSKTDHVISSIFIGK